MAARGIHHVGSTAVPGPGAKRILDIMSGVRELRSAVAAVPVLQRLSYGHAHHRPGALWFCKPASASLQERTCQLHLTEPGSSMWRQRLAFRDALRADPELPREYQHLKLRLGSCATSLAEHTAGKRAFVSAVLARSGIQLLPR